MQLSRFLIGAVATLGVTACGISRQDGGAAASNTDPVDRALAAAGDFLMRNQSPDGAWRSTKYGAFKDGGSLTPNVLVALLGLPPSPNRDRAVEKGMKYLAHFVRPDGSIDAGPHGLSYPVYTAAGAVRVFSHPGASDFRNAREAWVGYLKARQLNESLGWTPGDREYGGWGYAIELPRKPQGGQPAPPLTESNLSATVFALEALSQAGLQATDPAFSKALVFVQCCQNFADPPNPLDSPFDDGGFFFIYDDAVRNKAGVAGTDSRGKLRFFSYGSMTADGLRALRLCGLAGDSRRVRAAEQWIIHHFQAETHPGHYPKNRESNRQAVFYYYCCSLAKALVSGEITESTIRRATALRDALTKSQRPDGSWANTAVAVREDDPIVATSLAVEALATLKKAIRVRVPSSI
jgi:hypothetical protein